jgi:hypothetical protein
LFLLTPAPAPVHSSVAAVTANSSNHQKLNLQFEYHNLAKPPLAVFKLAGDVVQVVPSYSSVAPVTGGLPPKAKAAV